MKKINIPNIPQFYIGDLPGKLHFMYGYAAGIIGIPVSFMGGGTFYKIVVEPYWPGFPFWAFYLIMIALYIFTMMVVFIFVVPSIISFNNKQFCKHQNPIIENLDMIKDKLGITPEDEDAWRKKRRS